MRSFWLKQASKSLALVSLLVGGSSVLSATTWDLVAGCGQSNVTSESCSGAAAGIKLSGYSTGAGTQQSPTAGATFAAAAIYNWGASAGLGIVATNEYPNDNGPHAFDNVNGIDAMVINFTSAPVNLSTVTVGWDGITNGQSPYTDSDLSIFAWTGGGAPTMAAKALVDMPSASNPITGGWTWIGNYSNVTSTLAVSTSIYSSYWLVSAYSTTYGGGFTAGNDAFKLMSVAGGTCARNCGATAPEPGSLALIGAGFASMVALRRRERASRALAPA